MERGIHSKYPENSGAGGWGCGKHHGVKAKAQNEMLGKREGLKKSKSESLK